jgi:YVTN family beta-propeller protein
VTAEIPLADQPYSVAVTPDGTTVYVTELNANVVHALDAATLKPVATIPVGGIPGVVAVTPDGSQAWVGNILPGDITIFSPATNTVLTTVRAGSPTATIDGAPIAITFVQS